MTTPTPMPPSMARIDAMSTALHNYCDAVFRKDAASAQSWRDQALLRIPAASTDRAKALMGDYLIIYMESIQVMDQLMHAAGDREAHRVNAEAATAALSKTLIELTGLEITPR